MKIYRVTAMWCMSCLSMKKVWKKSFSDYPNIEIIDIDYDQSTELVQQLQVGKILPELIVYNNNKEIKRIIGEKSKKEMMKILEELNGKN